MVLVSLYTRLKNAETGPGSGLSFSLSDAESGELVWRGGVPGLARGSNRASRLLLGRIEVMVEGSLSVVRSSSVVFQPARSGDGTTVALAEPRSCDRDSAI